MPRKKRFFSKEFKLQIIQEADSGISVGELSRKYELGPSMIARWRRQMNGSQANPFPGKGSRNTEKARIEKLERIIGRQTIEIEFLKSLIQRLKESEG